MWYMIALVWIVIMVAIVSTYTRKQRRRKTERAQHLEKMLGELKANAKLAGPALEMSENPAAAVPRFSRKPRLLPQSTALLYYIFRTGLPGHEIFAGLVLAKAINGHVVGAQPAGQGGEIAIVGYETEAARLASVEQIASRPGMSTRILEVRHVVNERAADEAAQLLDNRVGESVVDL